MVACVVGGAVVFLLIASAIPMSIHLVCSHFIIDRYTCLGPFFAFKPKIFPFTQSDSLGRQLPFSLTMQFSEVDIDTRVCKQLYV